jgi:hypothetical protein
MNPSFSGFGFFSSKVVMRNYTTEEIGVQPDENKYTMWQMAPDFREFTKISRDSMRFGESYGGTGNPMQGYGKYMGNLI